MTMEAAVYLNSLDPLYPATGDQIAEGDDHIRQLKTVLKATFPGRGGEDMRVVAKNSTFTPAVTEVGVIFNASTACTANLPALSGVPSGTHYYFKATGGAITLVPSGSETLDGSGTTVVPTGNWALVAKAVGNWSLLSFPATLTGSAIVSLIGTLFVANATYATSAGSAGTASTAGYATTAGSATSASSATTAGSCSGNAASATTLQGYVPANFAAAGHTHAAGEFPPAFTTASVVDVWDSGFGTMWHYLRLTRTDGTYTDIRIS